MKPWVKNTPNRNYNLSKLRYSLLNDIYSSQHEDSSYSVMSSACRLRFYPTDRTMRMLTSIFRVTPPIREIVEKPPSRGFSTTWVVNVAGAWGRVSRICMPLKNLPLCTIKSSDPAKPDSMGQVNLVCFGGKKWHQKNLFAKTSPVEPTSEFKMEDFKSHSIPFRSPVFTLAAHPSEPLFTAGLLSGHVYTYTWPKEVPSDDEDEAEDGLPGGYKVAWKTRRHKGSCRGAAYSHDGQGS